VHRVSDVRAAGPRRISRLSGSALIEHPVKIVEPGFGGGKGQRARKPAAFSSGRKAQLINAPATFGARRPGLTAAVSPLTTKS